MLEETRPFFVSGVPTMILFELELGWLEGIWVVEIYRE